MEIYKKMAFKKIIYNQKGMTVLEVILIVLIIGFMALLINNLPGAVKVISISHHSSIAKDIADKEIELLRRQPYSNLVNGTNSFTDPNLDQLPSSTASDTISDCSSSICTNSESVKEAQVIVSWNEEGTTKSVEIDTLITDGGLGK